MPQGNLFRVEVVSVFSCLAFCIFCPLTNGQDTVDFDLSAPTAVSVTPQTLQIIRTGLSAVSGYVKISSNDLSSYASQLNLEDCPIVGTLRPLECSSNPF